MAKSTSVALAIGAMLAGGAVVAGVPLVATPAGAATMSAQHGLVLLGHPHARGQRKRHKKGHRLGQRLWEKQRQHQFLMRDLTLVLVPYQKETTDAQALPYNWQYDGSVAQQYGGQSRQSTLDETAEAAGINLDGEEHNGKTEVSPKADERKVEVEDEAHRPAPPHDPVIWQGDVVPTGSDVPPTAPPSSTDSAVEFQVAQPATEPAVQPATEPAVQPAVQPSEPVVCGSAGTPLLSLPLNLSLTATVSLGGQQEAAQPGTAQQVTGEQATMQQGTAQQGTAQQGAVQQGATQPQATTAGADAACAPSSAS